MSICYGHLQSSQVVLSLLNEEHITKVQFGLSS